MKTYKTLVAVISMMALLATSSLNAQTVPPTGGYNGGGGGGGGITPPTLSIPDQLPISMDDLQARVWEKIAEIGVYGHISSSIRGTTNDHSSVWLPYEPTAGIVDIEEVFAIVKAQRLQFSVLYENASANLGSAMYDKNGINLLYANTSTNIIIPRENDALEFALDLEFNMSDNSWPQFANATYFRIVERDANGLPIRYYYSQEGDIWNGMIRFPNYFSDKGGEITIMLKDGTEVAYGLNNHGKKITPRKTVLKAGRVSALGVRTFRTPTQVYNGVGLGHAYIDVSSEEFERNINPIGQLVVTGNSSNYVSFAGWIDDPLSAGGVKENASAVRVWQQGSSANTAQVWNMWNTDLYHHIVAEYLSPGHYWVQYVWSSGWPNGNQFYPPYQGGGEGKGTQTAPTQGE